MGYPRRTADLVSQNNIFVDITNDRVGIGTDSPQDQLDVLGNITFRSKDTGSSAAPELKLYRDNPSPADANYLGQIKFAGESDTGVERNYAKITGKIGDASNGTEDGIIEIAHIKAGSQNISARWTSSDLKLLNGTGLEVAGDLTVSGNTTIVGTLTYEDVTNIDSVGLITARSGMVVSGVSTFSANVDIGDNDELRLGDGNDLRIYHESSSGDSVIRESGTGNLRIGGANVEITSPAGSETYASFNVNGAVELYYDNSKKFETTTSGITVTGSVNATSDLYLKENIQPVKSALEIVNQLEGVRFDWKDSGESSLGVIAQDLEKVLPELVSETNGVKSVNYNGIIAVLIQAIKELNQK